MADQASSRRYTSAYLATASSDHLVASGRHSFPRVLSFAPTAGRHSSDVGYCWLAADLDRQPPLDLTHIDNPADHLFSCFGNPGDLLA